MEFGFIIPSFCRTIDHLQVLKYCIKSIRNFYPTTKIVIINDFSEIDIELPLKEYNNITFVMSYNRGAADQITYDYFYNNKLFDIAIIMQDSMFLENKILNIEKIDTFLPLWYATNHRLQWDTTNVPKEQINNDLKDKVITHSDHIITYINKFIDNPEFLKYALNLYNNKDKWSVCFGTCSIISHDFLIKLQNKTSILNMFKNLKTNWQRRISESVFPIACQYLLENTINEKSLNGLYYNGIRHPINGCHGQRINIPELKNYTYCIKGKYISKISFNRRR